jgi:hypothetical protein
VSRRLSRGVRPRVGKGVWLVQMVIIAAAAIGMFAAVMLLVLGLSRRPRPVSGRRIRAKLRRHRPQAWPPANAGLDRVARAGPFGYGPPSLWGDVPDDPRGWR